MVRRIALLALALVAAAARADWELLHEERFDRPGAVLDRGFWEFERGFMRNREAQFYTPGNVRVDGGALVIEARREALPNPDDRPGATGRRASQQSVRYTSGALISRQHLQFVRMEVVARGPTGAGVWPAVWLSHESPVQYGEIDVFEAVGKHPDMTFAGVHYGRTTRGRKHDNASLYLPGFDGKWHTHTLEWTPERIEIGLDGRTIFRFDPQKAVQPGIDPLRQPMRLRINLALGGNWGGRIDDRKLPARFEIAQVRIWRWAPGAPAAPPPAPAPAQAPPPPVEAPADTPVPDAPDTRPRWGR